MSYIFVLSATCHFSACMYVLLLLQAAWFQANIASMEQQWLLMLYNLAWMLGKIQTTLIRTIYYDGIAAGILIEFVTKSQAWCFKTLCCYHLCLFRTPWSGLLQGGPSASGKKHVDPKFEISFGCKFILWPWPSTELRIWCQHISFPKQMGHRAGP